MSKKTNFISAVVLLLLASLVYTPLLNKIGYLNDDWYLMYAARVAGSGVFRIIYNVDRPLRAYVLGPAYQLFGQHVGIYNLNALLFRWLSALFFLWLLNRLWPRQDYRNLVAAMLYLIYPGFLSQHNGIDYQSQMLSLALAMLSLTLTAYVFFEKSSIQRLTAMGVAILTGMVYLGLVEYEVGFEAIRVVILWILAGQISNAPWDRLWKTVKLWLPYSVIILGFGIWRVFFFHSDRGATDVNIQFEQARLHPIQILYHWALQVAQDALDVTLGAWVTPLAQLTNYIQRWGGILALVITVLVVHFFHKFQTGEAGHESAEANFTLEAVLLGITAVIGGLIPIAMVNRDVSFPDYSRYALVASVGAAILIMTMLANLKSALLRDGLLAGLCFIAILTHHANAVKASQATEATNQFWYQVSWRIPQLEPNTTLVALYPNIVLQEDYFIWGPASLIYYPYDQSKNKNNIQPYIYAAILNQDTITNTLAGEKQQYDKRRGIITYVNYHNLLVLSQPTLASCVHVINGSAPEYSNNDLVAIRAIGSYSDVQRILPNVTSHVPPPVVFGPEPDHGWCFYFQKADLARQLGDWKQIAEIGKQTEALGLFPVDPIEWLPFIQAYAETQNVVQLQKIAVLLSKDPYSLQQACHEFSSAPDLATDIKDLYKKLYCAQ